MFETLHFLLVPPESSLIYAVSYSSLWVTVSVLLAILASFAALKASARILHSQDTFSRLTWILISSFTLGAGVWAMHFVGMLALSLPCGIHYDPLLTLVSMIPGILAGGVALGVVWQHGKKHLSPLLASFLLGAGIGTMHYTGMAAMHLDGFIRYNPTLFTLSIVVAVALSYLALIVKDKRGQLAGGSILLVAVILGGAVSAMHYTAMSATYFMRGNPDTEVSMFTANTLAILVAVTTVILALAAMALAATSRNREITEQLRDSEQRLTFALEGAEDGVWDWNPQTDLAIYSKRWKDMIGYDEHEFPNTGTALIEHLHPVDKERVVSAVQNYFAGTTPLFVAEFRVRCKDGSWKWLLSRGKVIRRDEAGKPLRMIGTHADISARKGVEAALLESHQQMYSLLNSMAEGAYGVDINGNCTFVNRSFLHILGFENADEIIGKHIHELIHHSHVDGRLYPATECRMYNAYRLNQGIHVADEVFWRKTALPSRWNIGRNPSWWKR
jgi:PAS domain S-box-containing protein